MTFCDIRDRFQNSLIINKQLSNRAVFKLLIRCFVSRVHYKIAVENEIPLHQSSRKIFYVMNL